MRPDFNDYLSENGNLIYEVRMIDLIGPKTKVVIRTDDFPIADDFFYRVSGKHIEAFPNYRHFTRSACERDYRELILAAKVIVTNNAKLADLTVKLGATILIDFHRLPVSKELTVTVTHYPKG